MKVTANSRLIGQVEIEKRNSSGEITQALSFDNIFLLSGYKRIIHNLTVNTTNESDARGEFSLHLGTGTSEPKITDTGLENRSTSLSPKSVPNSSDLFQALTDLHGQEVGDGKVVCTAFRFTYNYSEGQAEGVWTELGLGDPDYAWPVTRALIRDESGTPMSLTVLSDEFLTVRYTIKIAVDKFYDLGDLDIFGSMHNVKLVYPWRSYVLDTGGSYNTSYTFEGTFLDYRKLDLAMAQTGNPSLNESTGSTSYNAGSSGEYFSTPSLTLDADGLGLTIEAIRNPTNEDMTTKTITIGTGGYYRPCIYLIFDPAVVKPADYRMTISLHIRYGPEGAPVRGVAHTATSDSLAFTWDAYANVTEYRLVLKEAGTVIEEQTVTTESATFSGLTAATEYELDIKPLTATYNGHASLHDATTEAA